ncbi:hypothetical protein SCLCIDRAFT_1222971 [Scleroderma citrinum Foug A]|uniref:Uncharacterized protein n=1 Tax=Scleroderma citrinum Foug A TaxID=1036808 RepID=A0A0C2ZKQ6_9AGAM|nr:hypothetical protein SCLCIDRAFT_1222971 [Scleroderma citrinum Foug A]
MISLHNFNPYRALRGAGTRRWSDLPMLDLTGGDHGITGASRYSSPRESIDTRCYFYFWMFGVPFSSAGLLPLAAYVSGPSR